MPGKRKNIDIGMSFLDVISCAFGAIVMLVLLLKNDSPVTLVEEPRIEDLKAVNQSKKLKTDIQIVQEQLRKLADRTSSIENRIMDTERQILAKQKLRERLRQRQSKLASENSRRTEPNAVETAFVGGIPVDREHIVFIIDTSGSMKRFWSVVVDQITSIIDAHPKVKGIQIMSDNGEYLLDGYAKRWIPDNTISRDRILKKLPAWAPFSNSSPAEGLAKALRFHGNEPKGISIYVMGDDFTGKSYDEVLATTKRLNLKKNNARSAKIHGIAFPWGLGPRFSTLMREVAFQNEGVLVTVHFPLQYGSSSSNESSRVGFD
jgi:hypothetical protein